MALVLPVTGGEHLYVG